MKLLQVNNDPDGEVVLEDLYLAGWHGATVLSAHTETEALALLRSERPDVVLIGSIYLIDLCRPMREISDAPMIILSASGQEEDISRALGEGAADYIVKPFRTMELIRRIVAVVDRAQKLTHGHSMITQVAF